MSTMPGNPKVTEALAACDAWTVLESLLPNTYKTPEHLAGRVEEDLFAFPIKAAPWLPDLTKADRQRQESDDLDADDDEDGGKQPRIHHTVVLASVNMDMASQAIISAFGEVPEGRMPNGWAALATVTLDAHGRPAKKDEFIELSSFAWAFPSVLRKAFGALSSWNEVKAQIVDHIGIIIEPKEMVWVDGEPLPEPVSIEKLSKASEWLRDRLKIDPSFYDERPFIFRTHGKPDALIVNSFFITDIIQAKNRITKGEAGEALRGYMRLSDVVRKVEDVLKTPQAISDLLDPRLMPKGRWPAGRDLVFLQQAAVNAAVTELSEGGVLGVNGPPGTGKTTLLRDIVAAAIVSRADAMAAFAWPASALREFEYTVREGDWSARNEKISLLDASLLGHEVLVASSNNGAVENVTRELPMLDAVATGPSSTMFPHLSDLMANPPPKRTKKERRSPYVPPSTTWGLIAAPLGNSGRRNAFASRFWFDADYGMRAYLGMMTNRKITIEERDRNTGKLLFSREPRIRDIEEYVDGNTLFERWQDAVDAYRGAKDAVDAAVAAAIAGGGGALNPEAELLAERLRDHLANEPAPGPGSVKREAIKRWRARRIELENAILDIGCGPASGGGVAIDEAFFGRGHREVQTSAPWLSRASQKLREDVFVKAMQVHRVFIDINAVKLLPSMELAIRNLNGYSGLDQSQADIVVPHLWAILSIFVPVISSTFASIGSMLRNTPPNTLGWLLIDEAGQATPQAAIGAVMRAKRVVVVGDPLQIPPVTPLPAKLIKDLFAHFGLDDQKWAAPTVSAQTLADEASPYGAVFGTDAVPRKVGLPLLVHRRCAEPMFSISNEVAYNGQMVSMTPDRPAGPIARVLGESAWLHFETQDTGKWIAEEGREAVAVLEALRDSGVQCPDISFITPFRDVANGLERLFYRYGDLIEDLGFQVGTFVRDRVGTVHTFQGRESEAVVMVLGGRGDGQKGARDWAGASPNILNVAVSRAKQNLYVIGDRDAWADAGTFSRLAAALP